MSKLLRVLLMAVILGAPAQALLAQGNEQAGARTTAANPAGFAGIMELTDEPGNWFRDRDNGTPVKVVNVGDRVDFRINGQHTNTRHTVTLLIRPAGSRLALDQDHAQNGTISAVFDVPGVYVIICKVHPYMTAVVAVRDGAGNIPDVTAASLPFVGHLGTAALPASGVINALATIAPTDADKAAKWDLRPATAEFRPAVPGVGEVWVNTQFERVPGQTDSGGTAKPGTITVVDAASLSVEREINGLAAGGMWNNPHNMWADFSLETIYNTNWFGKWLNKIDRRSGRILESIAVGEAPTHVVTIPTPGSPLFGVLTIPLSAENDLVRVADTPAGLRIMDRKPTGEGRNHPHGHWLTCGSGDRTVVPNVFKGTGTAGSISILDTAAGKVLREFLHDPGDPLRNEIEMPIAVGECHVNGVHKAYVANAVSGSVTVINVDSMSIIKNIPVTLTPDGRRGQNILHTLQVPIQTPVSPDERFVATAVLSLSSVPRSVTGTPDHVALIDTATDEVVKFIPTPLGTHGANWGIKKGGGYYAYVTAQFSNVLAVLDPDPNLDGHAGDAAIVGILRLANNSAGAGVTDGTGGQGVKPLPMTHDGWIQPTAALAGSGRLSPEVEGWINQLTPRQRNPVGNRH